MINALCVDVEPWYLSEFVRKHITQTTENDQVAESVVPLLKLLDKYNVKATFAVLGIVAERHPQLVKKIFDSGHEIASHSYSHRMLKDLGEEAFENEIRSSIALLTSITGERPIGFRAPSFSLDNSTRWALPVLLKHGFKWDASICPVKTVLYGAPGAPLHPYRPSLDDVTKEDANGGIIEFPTTIVRFGISLPVAGGFYLRVLPLWFSKLAIKRINKSRPANVYLHPWEMSPRTPRLPLPFFSRFVTYYGSGSAMAKLEAILAEFQFKPIREVLGL